METLDLACGPNKVPGSIGIDSNPAVHPDILHDLDEFPYPFADDTFDRVVCLNGIEHLRQPLQVLAELARICRNGAIVEISTPHFSSPDAHTDPTHVHALSSRSFDYLVGGTELHDLRYEAATYEKLLVRVDFIDLPRVVRAVVTKTANKGLLRYERHWAYLIPAHQLHFRLRVTK